MNKSKTEKRDTQFSFDGKKWSWLFGYTKEEFKNIHPEAIFRTVITTTTIEKRIENE